MDEDKRIPSDSDLLHAIQTGNEAVKQQAKARLCRKYDHKILHVIESYLWAKNCPHRVDHASDVRSQAWINILRNIKAVDPNKFEAWALKISINECNRHLTTCINGAKTSVELKDESLLPAARIADYYKSRDAAIDAERILSFAKGISPEFAQVYRYRILEDLDFDRIAELMEENKAKLRTIYYRGLRLLMAKFHVEKD